MATKTTKQTDAPAAETAGSVATRPVDPAAAANSSGVASKQTVTAIACALLQSPRFAGRATDADSQDLIVRVAVSIAEKINQATA